MPGMYREGEYDIAGTIVGWWTSNARWFARSPGRHADWSALGRTAHQRLFAREKVLFDTMGLKTTSRLPELRLTLGDELLRVHKNYQPAIASIRPGRSTPRPTSPEEASSTTCPACCPRTVRQIFAVVPGGVRRSFKSSSVVGTSARSKCIRFLTWASDGLIVPKKHEAEVARKTRWSRCWGVVEGPGLLRWYNAQPDRSKSGRKFQRHSPGCVSGAVQVSR